MAVISKTSLHSVLSDAQKYLKNSGVEAASLDAKIFLQHAAGITREDMLRNPEREITEAEYRVFKKYLERRKAREPLAYITGNKEFWGLDFVVNSDVLIPRPDSETLVEEVLKFTKNRSNSYSVLDLGVGSGCLLLSILSELPAARGLGVDFSAQALEMAAKNAAAHNMSGRAGFIQSNWLTELDNTHFDVIISNPPYIAVGDMAYLQPEVAEYEPKHALLAGSNGLDVYQLLAGQLKPFLKKDGIIVLEVGAGQAREVAEMFVDAGFTHVNTACDLAGIERCLTFTYRD